MRILIVDDEPMQRNLLKGFLEKQGFRVIAADSGQEALRQFSAFPIQLVLLDQRMPDLPGDRVLEKMKRINPLVNVIMITAYGSVETAVKAMKYGADDFLEKPVDLSHLMEKIHIIEQRIQVEEEAGWVTEILKEQALPLEIIGCSPAMKEILSLARRIAPTPYTVLIKGETGTGKDLIARLIHLLSERKEKPFIGINCAAIPENLFESELFGHEKGAFTGACSRRRGCFELALGGTLFLDEIGELPLKMQAKLLRALQEQRIRRIGGEAEIKIDVRVLAATNADLKQSVTSGGFREDLFYRLNVLDIELPPLRRRKEDIPALVDFFLGQLGSKPMKFSKEALTSLLKYSFPGNVRELKHMIQRVIVLSRGGTIHERDLPVEVRFHQASERGFLLERLETMERALLLTALEKSNGVKTKAADVLGISERVLRYKIEKYNLTVSM